MIDLLSSTTIEGKIKAVYGGDMMTIEFSGGVIGVKIKYANVNGRYSNVGDLVHVYGNLREFGTTFIVEALTVFPVREVELPKSNELDDGDIDLAATSKMFYADPGGTRYQS